MTELIIDHSRPYLKSHPAIELVRDGGVEAKIICYLNYNFCRDQLTNIFDKLKIDSRDILRTYEPLYKEYNLFDVKLAIHDIISFIIRFRKLFERAIVVFESLTIIGKTS
ncbi:MAG: hypothetical protein P8M50_01330 [Paracoccaceae bacterium]|nr:hypothetical protein [Paracoccaceae bacterium]